MKATKNWSHLSIVGTPYTGFFKAVKAFDYGWEQWSDFDLWIGLKGRAVIYFLGHELEMKEGSLLLVPPKVTVQLHAPREPLIEMVYLHFDCLIDGEPIRDASTFVSAEELSLSLPGLPTIQLFGTAPRETAHEIAQSILSASRRLQSDTAELDLQIQYLAVMRRLRLAHIHPGAAYNPGQSPLDQSVAFMRANLHRTLDLGMIARHAAVSPRSLSRLFHTHLRTSPMRYLIELRLAHACDLLRDPSRNISEVAAACGYESSAFFCRSFKGRYGITPSEYRSRNIRLP
jgi:AraC-like DNA-binding protein